jgi:hypothetical protein
MFNRLSHTWFTGFLLILLSPIFFLSTQVRAQLDEATIGYVHFKTFVELNTDSLPDAPELDPSFLSPKPIILHSGFSSYEALIALFPGEPQILINSDTVTRIYWRCTKCTPLSIDGKFDGDTEYFVDSSNKDTRFLARFVYKNIDGKSNILIASSTTDAQEDRLLTGRFTCGIVSLAVFTEQDSTTYRLTKFVPAWRCLGQFCTPPIPELLEIGPAQNALILKDVLQGGGGPVIESSELTSISGNFFKDIFSRMPTSRWNVGLTNYQSRFITQKDSINNGFYQLVLESKGEFNVHDWDKDEIQDLPKKLIAESRKKGTVHFVWKNYYKYDGLRYQWYAEKLKMGKGKS